MSAADGPRADAERAGAAIRQEPWYADTWIKWNIDDPQWRQQIGNDPLAAWLTHYNEVHPHKALGYRSPREYINQTRKARSGI